MDPHLLFEFTQTHLLALAFSIKSHKIARTHLRRVLVRRWAVAEVDLERDRHVALLCLHLGRRNHGWDGGVEILVLVGYLPAASFEGVIPRHRRLGHSPFLVLDGPLRLYALAVPMRLALPTCALLFERHSLWVIAGKVILQVIDAPSSPWLLSRWAGILPKRPLAVALDRRLLLGWLVMGRLIDEFQALVLGEEVLLRRFLIPEAVALAVLCGYDDFFPGEPSRHVAFTYIYYIVYCQPMAIYSNQHGISNIDQHGSSPSSEEVYQPTKGSRSSLFCCGFQRRVHWV